MNMHRKKIDPSKPDSHVLSEIAFGRKSKDWHGKNPANVRFSPAEFVRLILKKQGISMAALSEKLSPGNPSYFQDLFDSPERRGSIKLPRIFAHQLAQLCDAPYDTQEQWLQESYSAARGTLPTFHMECEIKAKETTSETAKPLDPDSYKAKKIKWQNKEDTSPTEFSACNFLKLVLEEQSISLQELSQKVKPGSPNYITDLLKHPPAELPKPLTMKLAALCEEPPYNQAAFWQSPHYTLSATQPLPQLQLNREIPLQIMHYKGKKSHSEIPPAYLEKLTIWNEGGDTSSLQFTPAEFIRLILDTQFISPQELNRKLNPHNPSYLTKLFEQLQPGATLPRELTFKLAHLVQTPPYNNAATWQNASFSVANAEALPTFDMSKTIQTSKKQSKVLSELLQSLSENSARQGR